MAATLLGSRRDEKRLALVFVKNKGFVDLVRGLATKFNLDFDAGEGDPAEKLLFHEEPFLEDELIHFQDDHITLDIFLGHKKAFLILISSPKLQQQWMEAVNEKSEWIEKINNS